MFNITKIVQKFIMAKKVHIISDFINLQKNLSHYIYVCCTTLAILNYIIVHCYNVLVLFPSVHSNCNNSNGNENIYEQFTKNCVVNISDVTLSSAEIDLLSKGLNFCPTPGEPDFGEIRKDLDSFHTRLRQKNYFAEQSGPDRDREGEMPTTSDTPDPGPLPFHHRKFKKKSMWAPPGPKTLEAFITSNDTALNSKKSRAPHFHNLTKEEEAAIDSLLNNPKIMIKPADKGSAIVVMNTQDYIAEGENQLQNPDFYIEVPSDRTKKHKEDVDLVLDDMLDDKQISQRCHQYLSEGGLRTPLFYMLPKIHKNKIPPPGRPILSANDCPTERISGFVDHFLRPIVENTKSYVKDTTHFLNILSTYKNLPPDTLIVTLDVGSLYTNIPNDEGIQAVNTFLKENRNENEYPKNSYLSKLLELVLTKNNFEFNDKHYLQVGGTAMGTRVAPSFANLFMAYFEKNM